LLKPHPYVLLPFVLGTLMCGSTTCPPPVMSHADGPVMSHADAPVMSHVDAPVMSHADEPAMSHADEPSDMSYSEHLEWSLGPRTSGDPDRAISDKEILAYASQPYSKEELWDHRVILGHQGGPLVVADYPCSDVCPDDTVRLVHYRIPDLKYCEGLGGVVRDVEVIYGLGAAKVDLCFPKVLIKHWQSYVR
jgi:hypothetical protein